ncbi:MAG: hypothetical protein QN123_08480, partial [Armatimonadota bacterium]|nr:hypothetical protein [Armatimonadota bacterium]
PEAWLWLKNMTFEACISQLGSHKISTGYGASGRILGGMPYDLAAKIHYPLPTALNFGPQALEGDFHSYTPRGKDESQIAISPQSR